MSDITFEPDDATFDDFMNSLPGLTSNDIEVDQAEIDALIAELAHGEPAISDEDMTPTEADFQELQNWLDSLDQSSLDMDL